MLLPNIFRSTKGDLRSAGLAGSTPAAISTAMTDRRGESSLSFSNDVELSAPCGASSAASCMGSGGREARRELAPSTRSTTANSNPRMRVKHITRRAARRRIRARVVEARLVTRYNGTGTLTRPGESMPLEERRLTKCRSFPRGMGSARRPERHKHINVDARRTPQAARTAAELSWRHGGTPPRPQRAEHGTMVLASACITCRQAVPSSGRDARISCLCRPEVGGNIHHI